MTQQQEEQSGEAASVCLNCYRLLPESQLVQIVSVLSNSLTGSAWGAWAISASMPRYICKDGAACASIIAARVRGEGEKKGWFR